VGDPVLLFEFSGLDQPAGSLHAIQGEAQVDTARGRRLFFLHQIDPFIQHSTRLLMQARGPGLHHGHTRVDAVKRRNPLLGRNPLGSPHENPPP